MEQPGGDPAQFRAPGRESSTIARKLAAVPRHVDAYYNADLADPSPQLPAKFGDVLSHNATSESLYAHVAPPPFCLMWCCLVVLSWRSAYTLVSRVSMFTHDTVCAWMRCDVGLRAHGSHTDALQMKKYMALVMRNTGGNIHCLHRDSERAVFCMPKYKVRRTTTVSLHMVRTCQARCVARDTLARL